MIPEFSMSRSMSVLGFAALVLVAGSAHSQSAEYRRGYDQGYRDGAAAAGNQSPYPNGMGQITISSALYGIRGARCDARDSLQALVAGKRRIDVKVDNDLCGDPAPNQANKQMTVTYSCGNGSERRVSGPEGSILAIGCR
ncbi:MAG: hypothetical protein IPH15_14215 [Comamonadaceae bacterium]|jgi:hypothetical protein|nr:hypothetical protein [Comamonadaceae bacterium]